MGLYFSWGFGPALLGIRHLVYLRVACENSWVKLETYGIHGCFGPCVWAIWLWWSVRRTVWFDGFFRLWLLFVLLTCTSFEQSKANNKFHSYKRGAWVSTRTHTSISNTRVLAIIWTLHIWIHLVELGHVQNWTQLDVKMPWQALWHTCGTGIGILPR